MGDLQVLSVQPNGFSIEDRLSPPLSPLLSNPKPSYLSEDCWLRAEQTTQEIIQHIQPSVISEQRRKAVIDYVQRLLRGFLGSEVFPFGSVPLKTYLPDGDIDLTALCNPNVEDALANDVRAVLEVEEQNIDADFEVKDVQYIHAEVKLIKCLVQNIVVDISFNQLGGLCTLCFLEQVDRLIGKNHLFKHSIILIKAWCYYESRILGAHHGLISTYALETMVLYIFHLFHSSLNGPLAVLYRFLDYYSNFDWDNYCISLNGPVRISSLPELVAETPDNGGGELLLDKDFLRNCVDMFSVPSRGLDTNSRLFPQKHFNIVDPLKENNNLGRSVSRGNFYRIRSAFTYGARKLGQILLLCAEDIADELRKFFQNTLDRHGSGQRPDVQVSMPTLCANGSYPASSKSAIEKCIGNYTVLKSQPVNSSCTFIESRSGSPDLLCEGIGNVQLSRLDKKPGTESRKEPQRCTTELCSSLDVLKRFGFVNENGISGQCLLGDAEDYTTSKTVIATNGESKFATQCELNTSPLGRSCHAPHLYLSHFFEENGKTGTRNPDQSKATDSCILENQMSSRLPQEPDDETDIVLQKDPEESKFETNSITDSYSEAPVTGGPSISSPLTYPLDNLDPGYREGGSAGSTGIGALNSLSDLSGDFDNHINNLLSAQWCHEYASSGPFLPSPPLPSQFQNKRASDNLRRSMQLNRSMSSHMNANAVFPRPHFFPMNPPMISGTPFAVQEMPKPRGTGTYFPNTNHRSYRDMPLPGKRIASPVPHGQLHRPLRDNNGPYTTSEMNLFEKGSHEPLQDQFPPLPSRVKLGPPEFFQDNHSISKGSSHANGLYAPSDKLEFGSLGQLPSCASSLEVSRQPVSSAHNQGYLSHLPAATTHIPKLVVGVNVEGNTIQSYHLKNEADFPPLSVPTKNEADIPPLSVPTKNEADFPPLSVPTKNEADFPPLSVSTPSAANGQFM